MEEKEEKIKRKEVVNRRVYTSLLERYTSSKPSLFVM